MSTSIFTGLSGLRSFETYLDVIGNNIANANTTGFRAGRVSFGDLLSLSLAPGSAPSAALGGTNPAQVGLGVTVKSIDQNTNTGSLLATDRNLDLTVFGAGMFVVSDGARDLYTRAGTFGFDAQGQLVELGTGFLVQSITKSSIVVPPNSIAPPKATGEVSLKGNLPAKVNGPLAEILSSQNAFQTGTSASITGANAGPFALADGQSLSFQVDGGTPQTVTFNTADFAAIGAATAAEVAAVINAQTTGITASDVGGAVVLTSDTIGSASQIKINDGTGTPAFAMGLSTVLMSGTQQAATGTVDLNALVNTDSPYTAGIDAIDVQGTLGDGTEFAATFQYGAAFDGTTLDDLVSFIDAQITDGTVTLDAEGNIVVTADESGEASFSLELQDAAGNTGVIDFSQNAFVVTQDGTAPDTVNTAITIFDKNGEGHVLSLTFERLSAQEWELRANLPDGGGTMVDDLVAEIRFDANGTLVNAGGSGLGDTKLEILFDTTGSQEIDLDLGTLAGIDGLTQFGGPATAQAISQDGFAAGTLADVIVSEDGKVNGVFSNGQVETYGQIALASFANPGGLKREGSNMFSETGNSGVPLVGSGGGPGGAIQAGVLESSNVDLAEEFVRMIEAQRGYQASARVIRASQELLQSLLQNI